jgi:hypothetical protein
MKGIRNDYSKVSMSKWKTFGGMDPINFGFWLLSIADPTFQLNY